jgi:hypothetical protein
MLRAQLGEDLVLVGCIMSHHCELPPARTEDGE